jgi:hypothetical protein
MIEWIKERLKERTTLDGAVVIGLALTVLFAAPVVKLVAWPALAWGVWTIWKNESK